MLRRTVDADSGWNTVTAQVGDLAVSLVPEAGCNVASIRFRDTELLRQSPSLGELAGFRYGVPVLYPTPGRVSEGRFTFEGATYTLPADAELGVIHGIACRSPFQLGEINEAAQSTSITCQLVFEPGTDQFHGFPIEHTLKLQITVAAASVRWDYTLVNESTKTSLPFGFGLHPWLLYQGSRKSTWLSLQASEKEVLQDGYGTGRRESIADRYRDPICLAQHEMDDVFCVAPQSPSRIEFRDKHLALTLTASNAFAWLVAYTPPKEPWLCVENWTSIPDAHNLHATGHEHTGIQVIKPGRTHGGWVQLAVGDWDADATV